MSFYIHPFCVTRLHDASVLYTNHGASLIENAELAAFLEKLEKDAGRHISKEKIWASLEKQGLDCQETLAYLTEHMQLMAPEREEPLPFDGVILETSHDFFKELFWEEIGPFFHTLFQRKSKLFSTLLFWLFLTPIPRKKSSRSTKHIGMRPKSPS